MLAIKPQKVRLAKSERRSSPGIRKEKGNSNAECHLSMGIRAAEAEFTDLKFLGELWQRRPLFISHQ